MFIKIFLWKTKYLKLRKYIYLLYTKNASASQIFILFINFVFNFISVINFKQKFLTKQIKQILPLPLLNDDQSFWLNLKRWPVFFVMTSLLL